VGDGFLCGGPAACRGLSMGVWPTCVSCLLFIGVGALRRGASALAAYASARERLADDLGVSPSATTEALHTAILLDELPARKALSSRQDTAALPGRAESIRALASFLDEATTGRGQVAMVEGEAGIG